MSQAKPKRVALYARTSTSEQNPAMQVEELRQVAQQRGWQIAGEYVDHGISGTRDRRPELDRLQADIRRGLVDVVLVWRYDRWARSIRHLVQTLDDLRARGIDFVSVRDGVDTSTPTGRFVFAVVAGMAELERSIIVERVRAGLQSAIRRGKHVGRPAKSIDLARARVLRGQGRSLRQVAAELRVGVSTLHRALAASAAPVPETLAQALVQVAENREAA